MPSYIGARLKCAKYRGAFVYAYVNRAEPGVSKCAMRIIIIWLVFSERKREAAPIAGEYISMSEIVIATGEASEN